MCEDALSKAERYREAANRYIELAKQAEPGYLAEVYSKIAAQYLSMAGTCWYGRNVLERRPGSGPDEVLTPAIVTGNANDTVSRARGPQ
jgi:hypothetical protein